MKRFARIIFGLSIMGAFLVSGSPASAVTDWSTGVNVNIGPPPVVYDPPPELIWIPGDVYYIPENYLPDRTAHIFYHNGYWWSPRGPRWYRAYTPEGPWTIIETNVIPEPLYRIPRNYRTVYVQERRHVPYAEWEKKHGEHRWKGKGKKWKDHDDKKRKDHDDDRKGRERDDD